MCISCGFQCLLGILVFVTNRECFCLIKCLLLNLQESNKTAQLAGNEEEPLGKAFLKYLDALSCGADDYLYSLHVGRILLLQNKPDEAVTRLQVAVGLKPMNVESRYGLFFIDKPSTTRMSNTVKYLVILFIFEKQQQQSELFSEIL